MNDDIGLNSNFGLGDDFGFDDGLGLKDDPAAGKDLGESNCLGIGNNPTVDNRLGIDNGYGVDDDPDADDEPLAGAAAATAGSQIARQAGLLEDMGRFLGNLGPTVWNGIREGEMRYWVVLRQVELQSCQALSHR